MRQPTDTCLLCGINDATQKDSHIIPKFFGKGLFENTKPRGAIQLSRDGNTKPIQDIPKESYLFCPSCEKGFSLYETYCARQFDNYNKPEFIKQFKHYKKDRFEYFECNYLDIRVFNLLIYSILWRISKSTLFAFGGFKLPEIEEEKIRRFLKEYSSDKEGALLSKIEKLKVLPNYHHLLIRPQKVLRPPSSMLSAASYNEILHQVNLVDYLLLFQIGLPFQTSSTNDLDNNRLDGLVKIGLSDINAWKEQNREWINEAIKK